MEAQQKAISAAISQRPHTLYHIEEPVSAGTRVHVDVHTCSIMYTTISPCVVNTSYSLDCTKP